MGAACTDDGRVARGFDDTGPTTPPLPECGGEVLPTVSFGGLFDQAHELLVQLGGSGRPIMGHRVRGR